MPRDLTEGSISKNLIKFSLPMMIGLLMVTAFNIIDTIWIGMLGPMHLAAIAITFPIIYLFISIGFGLWLGSNALISQALGARDLSKADNIAEHSLFLALIVGLVFGAIAIFFAEQIFTFLGATPEILPLTLDYANIIFIGFAFMFLDFASHSILRAEGNTITPMKVMFIAVIFNAVLDPLLIFGFSIIPETGIQGAAIATLLARILSFSLLFSYILLGNSRIKLNPKDFKPKFSLVKEIFKIGLPNAVSNSFSAVGMIAMTAIVGFFGEFALAAFGVALRLESMVILPVMGIAAGVVSIVGQNIGAGKIKRARKTVMLSVKLAFMLQLILASFLFFFPSVFYSVFTQDLQVITIGISFLTIVAFAYPLRGIYFMFNASFQGSGKTLLSMLLMTMQWAVAVILALFLSQDHLYGLNGVWLALLLSNVVSIIIGTAIYYSNKWIPKSLRKQLHNIQ